MFINFSNHPSRLWAEEERNAALQYGTIEDLAFPQVPADMSSEGVCKLAEEYAGKDSCETTGLCHVPGRILFKLACDCPPERSRGSGGSSLQRADS